MQSDLNLCRPIVESGICCTIICGTLWILFTKYLAMKGPLIIFVYLSSLPVAHLSDAPRRRLIVKGDSARIQDETTENSAWFFNVLGA